MHFEAGVGHIGGNLSCLDILVTLFGETLYDGDSVVLSKGHSAGALYVALAATGRLEEQALQTFHLPTGTLLAGHPVAGWHPDIAFATGSLGHGLSLAAGLAHAKRLKGEHGRVFCVLSDGELNEGSTWEAIHYAAQQRLSNLVTIVDANGLQGFGATRDVMDRGDLRARLAGAGLSTLEIDGHDGAAIARALEDPASHLPPRFVVARTVKGKGISFMENRMEWHYLPLSQALFARAMAELDQAAETAADAARALLHGPGETEADGNA
jgi:transketolase